MARKRIPIHAMNVVPYIDVMLVLLIIFMVAAPLIQTTTVELPKSNAPSPEQKPQKPIRVEMITSNQFQVKFAEQEPIDSNSERIKLVVEAIIKQEKLNEPNIYFAASASTLYGDVIEVADKLREVTDATVSLLMEKKTPVKTTDLAK